MLSDRALLSEIGQKIKRVRLEINMSQKTLAERSGLSAFSISQIENGNNTSMLSLIMVLRAMNALDMLSPFLAEDPIDPIAIVDYIKSHPQPKRARSSKAAKPKPSKPESEW